MKHRLSVNLERDHLTYIVFCASGNDDHITGADMIGLAINDSFGSPGVEGEMLVDGMDFLRRESTARMRRVLWKPYLTDFPMNWDRHNNQLCLLGKSVRSSDEGNPPDYFDQSIRHV